MHCGRSEEKSRRSCSDLRKKIVFNRKQHFTYLGAQSCAHQLIPNKNNHNVLTLIEVLANNNEFNFPHHKINSHNYKHTNKTACASSGVLIVNININYIPAPIEKLTNPTLLSRAHYPKQTYLIYMPRQDQ